MLALIGAMPAKAFVDVWNEDGKAYHVVVTQKTGQTSQSVDAGEFWKGVCDYCVVKIRPLSSKNWTDQIEASGNDVVTIQYGSLRIGEGSRK